ncbi:MAG: DNA-binding LytR/AlgR family response regulator [Saprospiraceae bacterium]|jgi:DNA-binding LytR/AlgR family response regulator
MIDCLIIEDEQPAQEILKSYIDKTPFLNCIGVYESGLDVPVEKIQQTQLLFLDIQLPELDGISYLKTISNPIHVIITSAYDTYTIEAFEEAVVDYLLKPYSFERFFKAVTRVYNTIAIHQKNVEKNFFIYADKTLYNIQVDDILYLKAEVDYVKVVTKDKSVLVLDSLSNWKNKVHPFNFLQVHRSYIIHIDQITKVQGNQVFIQDEIIPIGKSFKEGFMATIKNNL